MKLAEGTHVIRFCNLTLVSKLKKYLPTGNSEYISLGFESLFSVHLFIYCVCVDPCHDMCVEDRGKLGESVLFIHHGDLGTGLRSSDLIVRALLSHLASPEPRHLLGTSLLVPLLLVE